MKKEAAKATLGPAHPVHTDHTSWSGNSAPQDAGAEAKTERLAAPSHSLALTSTYRCYWKTSTANDPRTTS